MTEERLLSGEYSGSKVAAAFADARSARAADDAVCRALGLHFGPAL